MSHLEKFEIYVQNAEKLFSFIVNSTETFKTNESSDSKPVAEEPKSVSSTSAECQPKTVSRAERLALMNKQQDVSKANESNKTTSSENDSVAYASETGTISPTPEAVVTETTTVSKKRRRPSLSHADLIPASSAVTSTVTSAAVRTTQPTNANGNSNPKRSEIASATQASDYKRFKSSVVSEPRKAFDAMFNILETQLPKEFRY